MAPLQRGQPHAARRLRSRRNRPQLEATGALHHPAPRRAIAGEVIARRATLLAGMRSHCNLSLAQFSACPR
eukprot:524398-Pyramimonas_sp.AAC.1